MRLTKAQLQMHLASDNKNGNKVHRSCRVCSPDSSSEAAAQQESSASAADSHEVPIFEKLLGVNNRHKMVISGLSLEQVIIRLKERLESDGHTYSETTSTTNSDSVKFTCTIRESEDSELSQ